MDRFKLIYREDVRLGDPASASAHPICTHPPDLIYCRFAT